ncbi:hypothetical protein [Raoultella terrigena]|jgi:hypothetical protein
MKDKYFNLKVYYRCDENFALKIGREEDLWTGSEGSGQDYFVRE